MGWMKDETGLEKRAANHVALTPLSHLIRANRIFTDRPALKRGESIGLMPKPGLTHLFRADTGARI